MARIDENFERVNNCRDHAVNWRARALAAEAEAKRLREALHAARNWMDRPGVDWWRHEHEMTLRAVNAALAPPAESGG
jgi:hypothetical protein